MVSASSPLENHKWIKVSLEYWYAPPPLGPLLDGGSYGTYVNDLKRYLDTIEQNILDMSTK